MTVGGGGVFLWLTLGRLYTKPDRPARSRAKTVCPGGSAVDVQWRPFFHFSEYVYFFEQPLMPL